MSRQNLSRPELEALHSVLRRAAERAERRRQRLTPDQADPEAERLAAAVADLSDDLARLS